MENNIPLTPPNGLEGNHILNNYFYNFELEIRNPLIASDIDVHINENISEASYFLIEDINENNGKRFIFNDNTTLNAFRDYILRLNDCNDASIGNNYFRNSILHPDISSPTGSEVTGVYLENSTNIEFHQNTFEPIVSSPVQSGFKNGLYVSGDADGLDLFCNEFYNVYNVVQFDNADINTDFGNMGAGANNTFELLPGYAGFLVGGSFVNPNGSFTGDIQGSNNIDYFFQGSTNSVYDPQGYGSGILISGGGAINEISGAGASCPPIPSQLLNVEPIVDFTQSIKAFPNPSSGIINVEVSDSFLGALAYVTDMTGRIVYQHIFNGLTTEMELPPGQYVLNLQSNAGESFHKKLVVF